MVSGFLIPTSAKLAKKSVKYVTLQRNNIKMARKKKELPEIKEVEISGFAAEGKALTRVKLGGEESEPIVVFVPYAAPGDVVDLKIDRKKHNYAEAHLTRIVKPSPMRIGAKCKHFTVCGGCKWQHIPYKEQISFKRQQVIDAFQRIAKVEIPEVKPTIGSHNEWEYRNKMEYTFSNKRWKSWEELRGEIPSKTGDDALGFHIPGAFDKVLHIDECWLQENIGNRIRNYLYERFNDQEVIQKLYPDIPKEELFYDIRNNHGLLRTLMIRPTTTGQLMICLVFGGIEGMDDSETHKTCRNVMSDLCEAFPEITTSAYVINKKVNDSISDQNVYIYSGPGYVEEKMADLKYRISPKSFYQTNSRQAEVLYGVAAQFAGIMEIYKKEGKPLIYDLYTGAGTIANYLAKQASKVIGIEYVEDAIKDAKINSEINGITNTEFYAGDMKDVLTEGFVNEHGRPDIVIVDPPRVGMHEDVIKVLMKIAPERIVYVSCNPATQARDIAMLDEKYKVTAIQPVDMFPHTHHVENVVKLEKRN